MADNIQRQATKATLKMNSGLSSPELQHLAEHVKTLSPEAFYNVIKSDGDLWDMTKNLIAYITDRLEICSLKQPYSMFKKTTEDLEAGINQLRDTIKELHPEWVSMMRTSKIHDYPLNHQIPSDELYQEFQTWHNQMATTIQKMDKAWYEHNEKAIYDLSCDLVILEINMLYLRMARQNSNRTL